MLIVFIFLLLIICVFILFKLLYEIGFGIPKRLKLLDEKIANLKLHVQETKIILREVEDKVDSIM